jgi:hypothetical protein
MTYFISNCVLSRAIKASSTFIFSKDILFFAQNPFKIETLRENRKEKEGTVFSLIF